MTSSVPDSEIRNELERLERPHRTRQADERIPWWERRIDYLIRSGRSYLIKIEGLQEIRKRARLIARDRGKPQESAVRSEESE
jgi:hypothetical protein